MPDDTLSARAADQSDPALKPQFRRTWEGDLVTGPDQPQNPAHGTVWHAPGVYARERAGAEWRRLVGGAR